ncbi:MAG: BatA domain-containing protein, partial [Acidobacteriota bacterium]
MSFAHPWMLWGLAGLLIPLLIHLFDRRRAKEVRFAALAFVLRSQKRTASRLKIRRLLIYALRSLMLIAIPIALAQPRFDADDAPPRQHSLAATAIVVDTSLATRWKRDVNSADRLIDTIKV